VSTVLRAVPTRFRSAYIRVGTAHAIKRAERTQLVSACAFAHPSRLPAAMTSRETPRDFRH
jgi:hypothetical protein